MEPKESGTVTSLDAARKRRAAESIVVCLECSAAHGKPHGAGTLRGNPGCPACGYVGWIGVAGSPFARKSRDFERPLGSRTTSVSAD